MIRYSPICRTVAQCARWCSGMLCELRKHSTSLILSPPPQLSHHSKCRQNRFPPHPTFLSGSEPAKQVRRLFIQNPKWRMSAESAAHAEGDAVVHTNASNVNGTIKLYFYYILKLHIIYIILYYGGEAPIAIGRVEFLQYSMEEKIRFNIYIHLMCLHPPITRHLRLALI